MNKLRRLMKKLTSWVALEAASIIISTISLLDDNYENAIYYMLGAIWCQLNGKEESSITMNNAST